MNSWCCPDGSVATVWQVLKPSDRPAVWRRQQTRTPDLLVNAFEHELTGANRVPGAKHQAVTVSHELKVSFRSVNVRCQPNPFLATVNVAST